MSIHFKQSTIGEILESEKEMVISGARRYGEYFINANELNSLLNGFIMTVNPRHFIFGAFLSHVRKHHTLALFSAIRLHHVQAMMNMRQVLEAGAWAAYAIAKTRNENFTDESDEENINSLEKLTKKRNKWLTKNYKKGSDGIKNMKSVINKGAAHADVAHAHKTFKFDITNGMFETPFFDIEDDNHVKTDLWMIGNVAIGLMDLFYNVNEGRNVIQFANDFRIRLTNLEEQNVKLKSDMMQSDRYKSVKEKSNKNSDEQTT